MSVIIGISGPSGSGKTTVSRALRQLYSSSSHLCQSAQILHQDDFYKPERDIPIVRSSGDAVTNWDCVEAVDMAGFKETLRSFREHQGQFPPEVREKLAERAKEDRNDVGETGVSRPMMDRLLSALSHRATTPMTKCAEEKEGGAEGPCGCITATGSTEEQVPCLGERHVLIVDGFMLLHDTEILELMDVTVLLRGSFETLKRRREARSGYVTLEGFWRDPKGYFEDCVWPEYVASHGHLFEGGDVEGEIVNPGRPEGGVIISQSVDMDLDESLLFVLDAIRRSLV